MALISTSVSTTGVIMSVCQRAGDIKIDSFQMQDPSQAELARRGRMKREG